MCALWVCALLAGCAGAGVGPSPPVFREFSGEAALERIEAQLAYGARHPGSQGHRQMHGWLLEQLDDAGWSGRTQPFAFDGVELANVIGESAGGAAEARIVLGAHFDTRPVADQGDGVSPVPGANDGASGVAVLLELATIYRPDPNRCQVSLVFFDAEDSGGLGEWKWAMGSAHYVSQLDHPVDAAIIVDMVGDRSLQLPRELNSNRELQDELWQVAERLGHGAFMDQPGFSMLDDHTAFLQAGIPAVDIIDFDYPAWHTEHDDIEQVSGQSLAAVGETVMQWLINRCGRVTIGG